MDHVLENLLLEDGPHRPLTEFHYPRPLTCAQTPLSRNARRKQTTSSQQKGLVQPLALPSDVQKPFRPNVVIYLDDVVTARDIPTIMATPPPLIHPIVLPLAWFSLVPFGLLYALRPSSSSHDMAPSEKACTFKQRFEEA
ncbi:hypothetical protein PQX77_017972 [Marasmius sp. AFHP31]|nr:hypothetical protein PQX77_017972 [Marasmius sp. AFHP31]